MAAVVVFENLALVFIAFYARRIVRQSMASAPVEPLSIPHTRDDVFGSWWRTAMQFPFHPRDMQLVKNVAYGALPRQRLDVWRMSTTPLHAPVVLFIHGGSWMMGDKREQGRPMLHEFVRRGWIAVVPNYRLAPRHRWPAQIEDVTRALGWVKKNVATFGGDPERVVIAGGSAGGQLAALAALSANDESWRPNDMAEVTDWSVRGAMPFYGVLEMTGDESHWRGLQDQGLMSLLEAPDRTGALSDRQRAALSRDVATRSHHGQRAAVLRRTGAKRHARRRPGSTKLRHQVSDDRVGADVLRGSCPSPNTPSTSPPVRGRRRRRAPPSPSPNRS